MTGRKKKGRGERRKAVKERMKEKPQRGQIKQLSGKRTEHRLPGSRTLPGSLLAGHPHGHTSQC